MSFRKGRGSTNPTPAYVSSMPVCPCRETGRVCARHRRMGVLATLGIVVLVVVFADPFPWDFVLSVLVSLILRG